MEEYLEIQSLYTQLEERVDTVLYEPVTPMEKSQIGVFVMHSDANYLAFPAGIELARRGYRVLCARVGDAYDTLDDKILDAKLAFEFLKEYPGVEKVVLFGHSGGATLMSAYQAVAENGVEIFQGDEKIIKASDDLTGLTAADGIMTIDSNWGNGPMSLFSVDPAIVNETTSQVLDPELNLFNPANGFTPGGTTYSDEFVLRFFAGQRARNERLIPAALGRLDLIENYQGNYTDDEPLDIPGMSQMRMNNKLYPQDIRFMSHTRGAWPLLHGDGSVTTEVVRSLRTPTNDFSLTPSFYEGTLRTTVRAFLSSYAIRTTEDYGYNEDTVRGIDWSSSYNCPPGNIQYISAPLLAMGMTASWEYLAVETIYENSPTMDKTIAFVEGADHMFNTATELEEYPGQFGDTLKTTCDYIDSWLSQAGRFI